MAKPDHLGTLTAMAAGLLVALVLAAEPARTAFINAGDSDDEVYGGAQGDVINGKTSADRLFG
jgi:hypothetical protein